MVGEQMKYKTITDKKGIITEKKFSGEVVRLTKSS